MKERQISAKSTPADITGLVLALRGAAVRAGVLICGLLLSRSTVFGTLSPFGAAYVAAAPKGYSLMAAIGALLGCLLPGFAGDRLRCGAAVVAVAGIRWALGELKAVNSHPAFRPTAAFCGVLMTGAVISASIGAKLSYDLVLYVTEGLLAASGAYFLSKALECAKTGRLLALDREECTSVIIAACLLGIGLCRIELFGFSLGRAALFFALFVSARERHEVGGAIAGISAGAVIAVSGGSYVMAGICALSGLAAGIFAALGSIAAAAAGLAALILTSVASGNINLLLFAEMLTAALIFVLVPKEKVSALLGGLGLMPRERLQGMCGGEVAQRLTLASKALEGVSETIEAVSVKLKKRQPEVGQALRYASEAVCDGCPISRACWECSREETQKAFDSLAQQLRQSGSLSRDKLPEEFRKRCARPDAVIGEVNRAWADFSAREAAGRRIAQVRSVIGDQLGGVSMLLSELADEAQCAERRLPEEEKLAVQALVRAGCDITDARCVRRRSGGLSLRAEISGKKPDAGEQGELLGELEDALDMTLEAGSTEESDEGYTLSAYQKPELKVEFAVSQHCCDGERLCGDNYEAFLDEEGSAFLLLSDGMGAGGRAAVDSAMTCGLTGKLLRAGFSFEGAMKVVNSALLVKSDDESLATLDAVRINLYDGNADICKAGAVQTFIVKEEETLIYSPETLPLGILSSTSFAVERVELDRGDLVVMISDGISGEEGWVEELYELKDGSLRALASHILERARMHRKGGDDDMTVLLARVA